MATRNKALQARRTRSNESLLLRSAESLGRMIGALQRQLDEATRRLSEFDMPGPGSVPVPAAGAKTKSNPAARRDRVTTSGRGNTKAATKRSRAGTSKVAASARGNDGAVKPRSRKGAVKATKKARPR